MALNLGYGVYHRMCRMNFQVNNQNAAENITDADVPGVGRKENPGGSKRRAREYLSRVEALVRIPIEQIRRDRAV